MFLDKFGSFKTEMDSKVEYAKEEFENLSERSLKLIKEFGCDPASYAPKDLFELLFNFARDFSEAYKKMQQKMKAEEERLKRLATKKRGGQS